MPTRLLALALVAQVAGVEVGVRLGAAGGIRLLLVAGVVVVVAAVGGGRYREVLMLPAVLLVAAGLTQRSLTGLERVGLPGALREGRDTPVRLTLVEDPVALRFSARVLARLDAWSPASGGWRPVGRRVALGATGPLGARLALTAAGDRLEGTGRFGPLRPWERHLRWRHAAGHLELVDLRDLAGPSSVWMRTANRLRDAVLAGVRHLPGATRGLVAGLVLGDTRELPDRLVVAFREAGLSHLLVVSGSNVALVLAVVAPFLAPLGLWGRCVGGLGTVLLFGTMTRWEPSVTRAVAMAAVTLLAGAIGRPQATLRVLVLAVGALLAVDPLLVRSLGFRLSVAATAGIAGLAGPLRAGLAARVPAPGWVHTGIATSMAAHLGAAPVLLGTFGRVPLGSVPANVLAAPLVGPLTVCGLVTGVVGGWVGPGLGRAVVVPTALLAGGLLTVARVAARVSMPVGPGPWLAAGALLLLGAARGRARRAERAAAGRPPHR